MNPFRLTGALRALAALLTVLIAADAAAAPKSDPWPRWEAHVPEATRQVDHGPWAAFLARYVQPGPDGVNRLDYAAVTPADRKRLEGYLDMLGEVHVSTLSRPVQQAYWINFYNALTVSVVLEHYPVDSILDIDISPGWFSFGPWDKKMISVEEVALSLNDIEHRILRPVWRDPRIHYAVNCASIGCPNLAREPFVPARLDQQLDVAARLYVNHPRAAELVGGELIVSSIYDWFEEDFGGRDRTVIEHLRRFADAPLTDVLRNVTRIGGHHYDWSLNEPAGP